jgi:hypothetical protein
VCADAVRAAVSSKGRSTQPARAAARQHQTEDMLGYHTFRRGDVVGYIAGADNEYCEEIVFGVHILRLYRSVEQFFPVCAFAACGGGRASEMRGTDPD